MYQVKKPNPSARFAPLRTPSEPLSTSIPGSTWGATALRAPVMEPEPSAVYPGQRVRDRYEMQDALVEALRETEHFAHLVPRVAECHRSFRHKVCEHRHEWAAATVSCNCRLCPHDSRKRSLRLAARWETVLKDCTELRYCVLAERNSPDLSAGLASLWRAWGRLRTTPLWKQSVKGAVVALEVTFNRDEGTWHPHLNVLFEGEYIPFEALRQIWLEATGDNGQTAFIRAADSGTLRELLKYVTKLSDIVELPDAVDEFLSATARRRFIRTYGSFYHLPPDETEGTEHCPDCGSTCIADVGIVHASQVVIDETGVLRIMLAALRYSQQPQADDFHVCWPRAPVNKVSDKEAWLLLVARVEAQQYTRPDTWKNPT